MIDLTQSNEKLYEIRLPDKTILKIRKPSQGLLIELAKLEDADGSVETLERVNSLTTRIFNRNTNGRVFSEEEIADMMDLETSIMVLKDYLAATYKQLGE